MSDRGAYDRGPAEPARGDKQAPGRYTLVIGQKNYSSWSMRAWLLLRHLGLPFTEVRIPLHTGEHRAQVRRLGGETGLVPVLRVGDLAIWDTLAIFEYLHEAHGKVWPAESGDRARARSLSGELHSSFSALRAAMPVNTRARKRLATLDADVRADIARACDVWGRAKGPWLFAEFGAADIMFAPVASRFQTYGVRLPLAAERYAKALLDHPLVAEWLALGAVEPDRIPSLEVGSDRPEPDDRAFGVPSRHSA